MGVKVEAYTMATIRENAKKLDYFDIRVIITDEEKAVLDQFAKQMQITDKIELLQLMIGFGIGNVAGGVYRGLF